MQRPSSRPKKPQATQRTQFIPLFIRQHLKSILIMICSAAVVIIMGLNGQRSDTAGLAPEQAFQTASTSTSQPVLTTTRSQSNSAQGPALTLDKMSPPSQPKVTPSPQSLPVYPVQKPVPAPEMVPNYSVQPKLGHFPYQEADPSRLVNAGTFVRGTYERSEQLDQEAFQAFQQMKVGAATQGIQLMIISGFRNVEDQNVLFEKQIARRGSELEAARSSAPPGHSEHHTGYALDIADRQSDTDLKVSFQETAAYQWLVANAAQYQFEQSFTFGNKQGVNFEPWHWRYVGPPRASQIFAAARQS